MNLANLSEPSPATRSARQGCRADAVWVLAWNSEAAHAGAAQDLAGLRGASRAPVQFLGVRGFLKDTVPLAEWDARESGTPRSGASAADRRHRAVGLQERRVVQTGARLLAPHGELPDAGDVLVGAVRALVLSAARRSVSSVANRQVRTWPSAVRRVRSQAEQNGRVTEAMTPTRCGPPSTTQRSAGASRARRNPRA